MYFLFNGDKITLIFALRAADSDIWADFQNCHIWAAIGQCSIGSFTLRAAVSEIWTNFQNCHIWAWSFGHWPKCQKLHIYSLSTPGGLKLSYFSSTGSNFRDTGRSTKLPYLGMKLCHWQKFQKLHIYFLSTPWGWNCASYRSTGSGF